LLQEKCLISYPSLEINGFKVGRGEVLPFGANVTANGVNFSIFSSFAKSCTLVLFKRGELKPFVEIEFPDTFKIGNVFSMCVFELEFDKIEYGYRLDGDFNPEKGHRFNRDKIVLDPYAKLITGREKWGERSSFEDFYPHRSQIAFEYFDWGDDKPLERAFEDTIIYELHVRGFTKDKSSNTKYGGTFSALKEKIPYLKELGVNAVELMPIFEFDELENERVNPVTNERLVNYWGYSTVGFFAPKAGYSASSEYGLQIYELKSLIKELHKNGIEVILDVVFNHSAEGNEEGPVISFKGIDNKTYYMMTPQGYYFNFSGCGNTLNCNNPVVRNLILDSLRYWASEYHVDGFRFDLASILGRDQDGEPLSNPPLIESLAYDPVLGKCKLIAEAWDAGGLYQVGDFPSYGRWAEWNGKFRDRVRCFLNSYFCSVKGVCDSIQGSPEIYRERTPTASVNFITAHDGFTLYDLFSYSQKNNIENGEDNADGDNSNISMNCGFEGESNDIEVLRLRYKMMKNAFTILMLSQGVPMICMGDEVARTQKGNNNAYCQDNEISWFDWNLVDRNSEILEFVKGVIRFRLKHSVLRRDYHFYQKDILNSGYSDISFHGTKAFQPDFSDGSRVFAFMLCGKHAKIEDDYIYVAMNMHTESLLFELPKLKNRDWYMVINTDLCYGEDIVDTALEKNLIKDREVLVSDRAIVVFVGV